MLYFNISPLITSTRNRHTYVQHGTQLVVFYVVERYNLTDIKRRLLSLLL